MKNNKCIINKVKIETFLSKDITGNPLWKTCYNEYINTKDVLDIKPFLAYKFDTKVIYDLFHTSIKKVNEQLTVFRNFALLFQVTFEVIKSKTQRVMKEKFKEKVHSLTGCTTSFELVSEEYVTEMIKVLEDFRFYFIGIQNQSYYQFIYISPNGDVFHSDGPNIYSNFTNIQKVFNCELNGNKLIYQAEEEFDDLFFNTFIIERYIKT